MGKKRPFTGILLLLLIVFPFTVSAEASYLLQIGDVLEILTWNEPNFTRDVTIRTDGKISFPLLDDVLAANRSPLEVKAEIQDKLKAFISNPNVTVIVKAPVPQRFYVLGEVTKTGEYELRNNMTILDAFAVAGGFTEWASKNEIILLRKENGKDTIVRVDYKKIIKGQDLGQNIFLKSNDTIIVP